MSADHETDPYHGCTDRERQWVDAYVGIANWNATEAARLCGYKDPEVSGWRMKQSSAVQNAIRRLTESRAMQAGELLAILARQANLNPVQFAECYRTEWAQDKDGNLTSPYRVVDWEQVRALGLGPLIKAVKQTRHGETVEFVDPQRAAELIGRALGLFADRLRVEGELDLSKLTDEELIALKRGKRPQGR